MKPTNLTTESNSSFNMKKFYFVAALTALMTLLAPCAWGEEWTLTYSDFYTSSYTNNDGSHTKNEIAYTTSNVMQSSNSIQFKKNSGYLYNTTPMPGNITKITLATATNFTIYVGDQQNPSSGTTVTSGETISGNYTYFCIKATSKAGTTATITVEYEVCSTKRTVDISANPIEGGTVKAYPTSVCPNKTVALSYTEKDGYYFDSWTVYNTDDLTEYTVTDNKFTMPDADVTVEGSFNTCTKLSAPTNVKTSSVTTTSATITWDAVDNATGGYKVYVTDYYNFEKTETVTATSYTLSGLTANTQYAASVTAIGDGHRYCESAEAEVDFTTVALAQHTITWSTPDGSSTTTVTEGNTLVLPTTPAAPGGCPDKVFVGWSATNIGNTPSSTAPEFVSSSTIPTASTTYYAVFADKSGSGDFELVATELTDWSGDYLIVYNNTNAMNTHFGNQNANTYATYKDISSYYTSSTKTIASNTTTEALIYRATKTAKGYSLYCVSDNSYLGVTSTSGDGSKLKWCTSYSENVCDWKLGVGSICNVNYTIYIRWNISAPRFAVYSSTSQSAIQLFKKAAGYTDYVTQCADCTTPQSPLSFTVNATTANLGEDGTVSIGFTWAEGNGAEPTYTITPTTGCTINGKQLVFSAAGTYTITARQDLATVGGVTYCGDKASQTITITKDPVFGTATIDKNTFNVACGDTTSMNSAAIITLGTNYNLTKDISVAAPEGFLVSINKTDNSKYASSVTLTPTASGENAGKITGKVYVRAYSAIARSNGYSGNITISGSEIPTQNIAVSSTVTCQEYELKTNDRGTVTTAGNYYTGATVTAPADPTGVCTDPINYIFDGWSETEVTDGASSYTKVSFPYTMPKGGATLYAVYKYAAGSGSVTPTKVNADGIVDGAQYFITAANNGTEYILKAGAFNAGESGNYNAKFDKTSATSDMAWTFVKSGDNWMIKSGDNVLATGDGNNKLYSNTSNTQTWICKNTTTTYINITNVDNAKRNLALYSASAWRTYTTNDAIQSIQLYSATAYSFTSSPACGVYITGTKGIQVTSAKDIWVEAADTMEVSATSLDKNEDGAAVSISAEVTSGNFTIKTAGTSDSGSSKLTLTTNCTDAAYSQKLVVVYTPTADNTTETGQILLRVYKTGGTTEYATATIDVQGRSLPEQFVIAAKTTDGWVALPSDLGTGSGSTVKAPYTITVDDESNPTKATQAPTTALYKGAERNAANTCAKAIRFRSVSNNAYLQASTAANNTGIWLSTTNSNEAQPWKLTSSNFADYNVRVEKSETGRYLGYDATQGKIANYKQTATLRFLPIAVTCTRYDAPTMTSTTAATDKVTLTWAEISGATEYEYSSDQTTWTTIGSVTTVDGVTTAVISGLAATTDYTYYIRVKTTGENCSEVAKVTFTTTDCEDVPNNLSAYASSNSVTISWTANAATSTVKIYSDAAGTTEVVSKTDAKSPCDLMGLKQNTKYYYQVFAGGSCKSAIETFTTETSEISVVEWFQDSLIVNVNTEGSDVSVVIEGQKAHGDAENKNIADGLFFSKYFEANNNVKLLAIYNGTKQDYDLSNYKIYLSVAGATTTSRTATWDIKINLSDYLSSSDLILKPDSEVILISYQDNIDTDDEILECAKNSSTSGYSRYHRIKSVINFSGNDAVALFNTTTNKFEDMIGAGTASEADLDGVSAKTDFMDAPGWYIKNGTSIEKEDSTIALSTNRCLLIRKNTVKDGLTAVSKNEEDFITFADEWSGKQVPSNSSKEVEIASSCEAFAYVGSFNYNDYYTAYDSIGGLRELNGHQNPDGTYTIPVNRIDTFACKDIRLVVKDNGTEMVNKTQRVPIMVVANTDTKNDTLFHFSADTCKKCDVVVRDNATLTHTNGGRNEFRDMYIYAGSHLNLPANQTFTLQTTHMHAKNDLVSYAIINNGNSTIKINKLVHVKRIDGHYWYPFSLPYDCKISDIVEQCGLDLGTYGTDWGIKYYDGQRRQAEATAASLGATGYHWYMMPSTGTLKANKGYIIALALPNENLMRSIYFTPAGTSNYLEDGTEKYSYISNWSDNLTADARHHGWNFVGSPYISLFGEGKDGQGLNNTKMKMGRTNTETGEQEDIKNVYVSVPNGGNTNTYTQSVASGVTLYPFKAYFVQAIDPSTSAPATDSIKLTYTKTNTRLNAPARVQSTAKTIFAELNLTNSDNSLRDNAGVLVGAFTADYEIGSDLTKMYAADVRPQLYTVDAAWGKMAYLAVADEAAHNISLGIYLPAAGSYTLSLNNNLSETGSADAVYLLYNGAVVANLLTMDYTVTATAAGTVNGYSLDIRRASETTTADEWAEGDGPQAHYREGMLYIDNLPSGAEVYVYDVLGRLLLNTVATDTMVSMPTVTTGVYTILVRSNDSQTVLKTLLR